MVRILINILICVILISTCGCKESNKVNKARSKFIQYQKFITYPRHIDETNYETVEELDYLKYLGVLQIYTIDGILIKNENYSNSSLSGNFFLGCGNIQGTGESGQQDFIKIIWKQKGTSFRISKYPINKIEFVVDDTLQRPTIYFQFDIEYLHDWVTEDHEFWRHRCQDIIPYVDHMIVLLNSQDFTKLNKAIGFM